jgi:putative transposase
VFEENFRVYGVRKVWRQLKREGLLVDRLDPIPGCLGKPRGESVAKPVRAAFRNSGKPHGKRHPALGIDERHYPGGIGP